MASINRITLIGNLGRDPERMTTSNGKSYAKFSVATNENYQDRNGSWQKSTEWHSVKVWGSSVDRVMQQLRKGSLVYIEGSLRSFELENSGMGQGQNKTRLWEVRAQTWRSLDPREGQGTNTFNNDQGGGGFNQGGGGFNQGGGGSPSSGQGQASQSSWGNTGGSGGGNNSGSWGNTGNSGGNSSWGNTGGNAGGNNSSWGASSGGGFNQGGNSGGDPAAASGGWGGGGWGNTSEQKTNEGGGGGDQGGSDDDPIPF